MNPLSFDSFQDLGGWKEAEVDTGQGEGVGGKPKTLEQSALVFQALSVCSRRRELVNCAQ